VPARAQAIMASGRGTRVEMVVIMDCRLRAAPALASVNPVAGVRGLALAARGSGGRWVPGIAEPAHPTLPPAFSCPKAEERAVGAFTRMDETLVEPRPTAAAEPRGNARGTMASSSRRSLTGWWRGRRDGRAILPLLVQTLAGFSKIDGEVVEADIDSSLSFLRNDLPTAYSSKLQADYQRALNEPQNLAEIAAQLAPLLEPEEKILLGMQLYVLISRARMPAQLLRQFYLFMTGLGVAAEAVGLVYQLNAGEVAGDGAGVDAHAPGVGVQPLDSLLISGRPPADVVLENVPEGQSLAVFRLRTLVLLKNTGTRPLLARGRQLRPGEFTRLYQGQRVVLDESVFEFQDLVTYLNAKKDVSSTQLYLAMDADDEPYVERTRSAGSVYQIKFGLGVEVMALRRTPARVRGVTLRVGERLKAGLHDKITFPNETEISLSELRRRAREMGGRFTLSPSKSDYLVSNNPGLLRPGDILLSPNARGELLLRISCDYEAKRGALEVLKGGGPIGVGGQPVRERAELEDGAVIDIGEGVCLRCHFGDRIIEEERNLISRLEVVDLSHRYHERETALDGISLTARRGELICVMGPSGCGKSTFLRVLAGHLRPREGTVRLNGLPLYENLKLLCPYISYCPHEDAFDEFLTVQENLDVAAAVRSPHLSGEDRRKRVQAKLVELGLDAARRRRAGSPEDKFLSGGERKRLNIGLDMIGLSDVFLFDEPTSGLSSKDSEQVLDIIRGLAHNKVVFVSIHQPSARLLGMFDQALLLDRGGRLAFYGPPSAMLRYFREAAVEEGVLLDYPLVPGEAAPPPEVVFDVMESPLRDLGGDVIYTEDENGRLAPGRRFSPGFWRDRFQARRILEQTRGVVREPDDLTSTERAVPGSSRVPPRARRQWRDELAQGAAVFRRAFIAKLRHRGNLAATLLEAPLLALLISFVLRYSEDGVYTFASAFHIPTYLFMTLVVGMFLGLTNSADDIVRDQVLLQRERNHDVRCTYYVLAKTAALAIFAAAQCAVYLLIGNAVLEVRSMFWDYFLWMLLSALTGVVLGLLISSLVRNSKTAINIIPLILIPQIILGGALIKYEEMNRNLDLAHNLRRWLRGDDGRPLEPPNKLEVPFLCEFMPLRWSYEAIVIAQANRNPLAVAQDALQRRIDTIVKELPPPPAKDPPELAEQLSDAKQALALVSGLEGRSPEHVKRRLAAIMKAIESGDFDEESGEFSGKAGIKPVSAGQLYSNQKIWDLFNKAEVERLHDGHQEPPNVFFGLKKHLGLKAPEEISSWRHTRTVFEWGREVATLRLNLAVLGFFCGVCLLALFYSLRRRLTSV